ncbi:MAG TPA: primosomal protein N', partial [Coriobacteriia bacterium]|nr:primosomal protein N' [Coriobacteriia bacterium]
MTSPTAQIAHVIVDIPARELSTHFDYAIAEGQAVGVGSCVLVNFANRPAVGYVVGLAVGPVEGLKTIEAVLGGPFFGEQAAEVARWIASEYVSPLSEAVRLFLPPGGTPKAVRAPDGTWSLRAASTGEVDDRWAELAPGASEFKPKANATMQRAIIDALGAGPVRVAELSADLGSVNGALKTLEKAGAVLVASRRRMRDAHVRERSAVRHERLTAGQMAALRAIETSVSAGGGVIALDGVTGSGKTEVYLRAIELCLEAGKTACVLVPEISLTPQTVGRFRSRFGDAVAVLHSRLSAGERYDQWDLARKGEARIVVGARSALFAPLTDVGLIVIDEEHESSYKQSSAPRYHAREVAEQLAKRFGATLVLGSASLSMETRERAATGDWTLVEMPDRVEGRKMPDVLVVDMGAEFGDGHRSMFSRPLIEALTQTRDAGSKAVLFLNRRGFASFLLCRECGYVPRCDSCATSLTFHDVGSRLMCHHCGSVRPVPPTCPECGSPYLRQFGAGTQRVETELNALLPDWPVVRMDADTTKGKGAHERLLAAFEGLESGVLLGTQMIAKGLDYPEVTLVGVVAADVTLNVPDFRAGERTYQLLEQVAGRAGRGDAPGRVVVQTYW